MFAYGINRFSHDVVHFISAFELTVPPKFETMRLALLVCVSVVMLYKAEGTTTIFNQNKGLLRAFNGLNPEHENRDTEGM